MKSPPWSYYSGLFSQTKSVEMSFYPLFQQRKKQMYNKMSQWTSFQEILLQKILKYSSQTIYGWFYWFLSCGTYQQFVEHVPVISYSSLESLAKRAFAWEKNILTPWVISLFTKSAGTTGTPKILPLSKKALFENHLAGWIDMVSTSFDKKYFSQWWLWKTLSLGWYCQQHESRPKTLVGNISALLYLYTPTLLAQYRFPPKQISMLTDRDEKLLRLTEVTYNKNIRVIAWIPAWIRMYFDAMQERYQQDILTLFPQLSFLFVGGTSWESEKSHFQDVQDKIRIREVYNASEWFFGFQDEDNQDMVLCTWRGIFYECRELKTWKILQLSAISLGVPYELIITTYWLYRYSMGDIVIFTAISPWRFIFHSRTKLTLAKFREDVSIYDLTSVTESLRSDFGYEFALYCVWYDEKIPRHIRYFESNSYEKDQIAIHIDVLLQKQNSDYAEVRKWNNLLHHPIVHVVSPWSLVEIWRKYKKLWGQHKLPVIDQKNILYAHFYQ